MLANAAMDARTDRLWRAGEVDKVEEVRSEDLENFWARCRHLVVAKGHRFLGSWGSLLKVAKEQDFHFVLL